MSLKTGNSHGEFKGQMGAGNENKFIIVTRTIYFAIYLKHFKDHVCDYLRAT